ncbi:hypothetical protein D9613_003240 [Agrocybe pediades]|uniref:Histone H1 n=1 Tax=Agrocybe pediades TaxID=84607 RepID=A0A8H4QQX4_9AGAR|nr:hypothetical protein D9613_003240 [Agrocybe pediades]
MSTKKATSTKPAAKKSSSAKPPATHPTWADMIKVSWYYHASILVFWGLPVSLALVHKFSTVLVVVLSTTPGQRALSACSGIFSECIAENTEDARIGVSRPQIKKYVENKYKLEMGAAQVSQLSRAITTGAEKGVFVLPKGLSGRVKLAPKTKAADSSAKENKPATNPASKAKTTTAKPKATAAKSSTTKPKAAAKSTTAKTTKAAAPKKTTAASKPKPKAADAKKPAAKKAVAAKPKAKAASTTKKTTTASKKAPAKKAVTGGSAASKAKAAATKKAPAKKPVAKKAAAKPAAKPATKKTTTKKSS